MLLTVLIYFSALLLFSRLTARRSDNDTFFRGNRQSPWYMVAFGMVGASISGITFVSVPGMVLTSGMTYLQMCLGFILGYLVIAFVLLPLYYRMGHTTIYGWLDRRLGRRSYRTGALFFVLSKMVGASVRFYVVCYLLQRFVLDQMGVPFPLTVVVLVSLIWLYTRRGGIRTLVWTDTFQTTCMLAALGIIIYKVTTALHFSAADALSAISSSPMSRIFVFDDWMSPHHFWKQLLSGMFVTIVMTGLDQDMMQKNLTCRSLRDAQKDMCTYGLAFVPVNALFLGLGVLLTLLAAQQGVALPAQGDDLLPMYAATGRMGEVVVILFTIGVLAAAFSSADSALTALTTTFCVDICRRPDDERLRRRVHVGMALVFMMGIMLFRLFHSTSIINAIYILCGYTYGPLLGLFAYGLLTRRRVRDSWVPAVCVASPLLCYAIDTLAQQLWGYKFGYELLMLNGLLTFCGLYASGFLYKDQ